MATEPTQAAIIAGTASTMNQGTLATPAPNIVYPIPVQYSNFGYFDPHYQLTQIAPIQAYNSLAYNDPSQKSNFNFNTLSTLGATQQNQAYTNAVVMMNNTASSLANTIVNPMSYPMNTNLTATAGIPLSTATITQSVLPAIPTRSDEKSLTKPATLVDYSHNPATTAAAILTSLSSLVPSLSTSTSVGAFTRTRAYENLEERQVCPNPQCMNSKTKKTRRFATNDRPLDKYQMDEFKKIYEGLPRDPMRFTKFFKDWDDGKIGLNAEGEIRFCRACRNLIYMTLKEKGLKKKKKKTMAVEQVTPIRRTATTIQPMSASSSSSVSELRSATSVPLFKFQNSGATAFQRVSTTAGIPLREVVPSVVPQVVSAVQPPSLPSKSDSDESFITANSVSTSNSSTVQRRVIQTAVLGPQKSGKSCIANYLLHLLYPYIYDKYSFSADYAPTKLYTTYSYADSVTPALICDFPGTDDLVGALTKYQCDTSLSIILVTEDSLTPIQKTIEHLLAINRRFCVIVSKMDDFIEYGNSETIQNEIAAQKKTNFSNSEFPIFFLSAKEPSQTPDHWMKLLEFLKSSLMNFAASENLEIHSIATRMQGKFLSCNVSDAKSAVAMVLH